MSDKFIVITSINGITKSVRKFAELDDWHVVVVGDRKTPSLSRHPHTNITYLSVHDQSKLGFHTYNVLPFNHYARKNLGYLYAIRKGAQCIADTDDDNIPYSHWGKGLTENISSIELVTGPKVVNIYRLFTNQRIWPRGFPLHLISNSSEIKSLESQNERIAIWQGLADNEPDVDAIYRLVFGKQIQFERRDPVALENGVYCPFNSQNTIWFPDAFVYLYLPIYVTFRFTDILRGYVAQRGIWAINAKLGFTSATVYQNRNIHNLMSDFIDELPCYTQVNRLIELLDKCELTGHPHEDLYTIYEVLYKAGIVKREELDGINAWIKDFEKIT
jgi:hypothetical protein